MNFEATPTQDAIIELAESLLGDKAGPDRARQVLAAGGHDVSLENTLNEAGLLDLYGDPDAGPLDAVLVIERVAAHQGQLPMTSRTLVAPALGLQDRGLIALASHPHRQAVRFGEQADIVLTLRDDGVGLCRPTAVSECTVQFGFPVATVDYEEIELFGAEQAAVLSRWWRIGLSAEIVGLAESALWLTAKYLGERFQFNRPIGGLQAVQHRLAELYVSLEGARWVTRYAVGSDDLEAAPVAAGCAVDLARRAVWELHQLQGAIGFTKEYDLHLMTMALHLLRLDMDGVSGSHARAVAAARWGSRAAS